MIEPRHKEVIKRAEQGCSPEQCNQVCHCTNCNGCKAKLLVHNYNKITDEEERSDFLCNLEADDLYILAVNGKLINCQLKVVYRKHAEYYYDKTKHSFQRYYSYCKTFQRLLSKHEKDLLLKKLKRAKHAHVIKVALRDIRFLQSRRDELHAAYVAYKLSTVD